MGVWGTKYTPKVVRGVRTGLCGDEKTGTLVRKKGNSHTDQSRKKELSELVSNEGGGRVEPERQIRKLTSIANRRREKEYVLG